MKKLITALSAVLLIVFVFVLVFCLYDSPAYYVKTPDGSIYIDKNGEPVLYYKDIFGREFYSEDGKRVYAAVPVLIEPVTAPEALSELQQAAKGE